jgi:hypothetical protein
MLTGAVLLEWRRLDAASACLGSSGGAVRPRRRVDEVGLVHVVPGQDRADGIEVHGGPVVARTRHGQLLIGQVESEVDHGASLQRLQTRSGVHHELRVADRGQRAVDADRHPGAVVDRLLQTTARRHRNRREPAVEPGHTESVVAVSDGSSGCRVDRDDRGPGTVVR